MRNVCGNRDFVFVWQEAIGDLGDGKNVDMKLYILKLNLATGNMVWSKKRQMWGDQSRSREDMVKTWTPGEGDGNGKDA